MIKIFTDGAALRNGQPGATAGWGWVAYTEDNLMLAKDYGAVVSDKPTNNRAEIQAILEAMRYAENVITMGKANKVLIYSDSAYCVDGYNDWMHNWENYGWWRNKKQTAEVKNRDLWIELYEYYVSGLPIQVMKVKGHDGIVGNEYADKLAGQGARITNENL